MCNALIFVNRNRIRWFLQWFARYLIGINAPAWHRLHDHGMAYPLLLIVHLLCATAFVGVVFVETLLLPGVRKHLPKATMLAWEKAFGQRARRVMPWIVLTLYLAGLGLAWFYRGALMPPWESRFGIFLAIKLALAASVAGHVVTALVLQRKKRLTGAKSDLIHRSVFVQLLLIVVIAKAMFHVG